MSATENMTDHGTSTQAKAGAMKLPAGLAAADRHMLGGLLAGPIDYIDDERFHADAAEAEIFAPEKEVERPTTGWYTRLSHERQADASLKASNLPLLTPAQEIDIFLQYNFARFRAESIRRSINPRRVTLRKARELLRWHRMGLELREKIAEYNLALVLAMAKRLPSHSVDFPEMISEGNMALLRGIDKFNVSRGFKFSTYACRAILKAFSRLGIKTSRYRSLFPVGFEPDLERSNYAADKAASEERGCIDQVSRIFHENRSNLSDIEIKVLRKRFAFDESSDRKGMTLQEVGRQVGLTKERVRQIQIHALRKMRETLEHTYLDGPSISDAMEDVGVNVDVKG